MKCNVGDIVKPKKECVFSQYYFKIKNKDEEQLHYELELLPWYDYNEHCFVPNDLKNWTDGSLDLVIPASQIEFYRRNLYDSEAGIEAGLINDYEKLHCVTHPLEIKINAPKINLSGWQGLTPNNDTIKKKEGIIMNNNIIKLYFDRKESKIDREYDKKIQEVLENDEIQQIVNEMNAQIEVVLENENRTAWKKVECNIYTEKTQKLEKELIDEKHIKIRELKDTLNEVEALFELTDDYTERMKILKNYNIVDKSGKLTV